MLVLEKIQEEASTGDLLLAPHLSNLLYFWKDIGSSDEPRKWVGTLAGDTAKLLALLEQFGGYRYAQTIGEAYLREEYYLDPDGLKPFIEPHELLERLKDVKSEVLSPGQVKALETFRREMASRPQENTHEEDS